MNRVQNLLHFALSVYYITALTSDTGVTNGIMKYSFWGDLVL